MKDSLLIQIHLKEDWKNNFLSSTFFIILKIFLNLDYFTLKKEKVIKIT